jgi:hypothetical protein
LLYLFGYLQSSFEPAPGVKDNDGDPEEALDESKESQACDPNFLLDCISLTNLLYTSFNIFEKNRDSGKVIVLSILSTQELELLKIQKSSKLKFELAKKRLRFS